MFVWNYGRITVPLTSLTKKDAFSWTLEATQSFEQLKEAMCKAPVFTTPKFTQIFVLEYDASRNGIVVVLIKEGRPIALESRPTKGKDLHTPIYVKEMLAILHALKKWNSYLLGKHLKVKIDHDSLKYFMEQISSSKYPNKCVTKMFEYDFEITYEKGKQNMMEDAHSIEYEDVEALLFALPIIQPNWC